MQTARWWECKYRALHKFLFRVVRGVMSIVDVCVPKALKKEVKLLINLDKR